MREVTKKFYTKPKNNTQKMTDTAAEETKPLIGDADATSSTVKEPVEPKSETSTKPKTQKSNNKIDWGRFFRNLHSFVVNTFCNIALILFILVATKHYLRSYPSNWPQKQINAQLRDVALYLRDDFIAQQSRAGYVIRPPGHHAAIESFHKNQRPMAEKRRILQKKYESMMTGIVDPDLGNANDPNSLPNLPSPGEQMGFFEKMQLVEVYAIEFIEEYKPTIDRCDCLQQFKEAPIKCVLTEGIYERFGLTVKKLIIRWFDWRARLNLMSMMR